MFRIASLNVLSRFTSALALVLLLVVQSISFGTGSHYDLTRAVLTEHEFGDVSIRIIQVENWLTDYYSNSPTYDDKKRAVLEKLHFDNLFNEQEVRAYWAVLLHNLRFQTEKAARNSDKMAMLVTLGIGLHAVQDFYAHSNWAELHPRAKNGGFRSETFWAAMNSRNPIAFEGLHTGKFPEARTEGPGLGLVPMAAEIHGGYYSGLNKDSPQRRYWDEAYVFAYAASHELVNAMENWAESINPGFWESVAEYAISVVDEKKLSADILAARNISMWLEGKGQDGTWKGDNSGSTRFFAAFSSKWVTADSSDFVRTIRDGHIQDEIASDLYSRSVMSRLPEVAAFMLPRTAVLIRITRVAESKKGNWLQRRLEDTGGSDFYSRINAGGQDFWGRTIQRTRDATDPWYEIFIADQSAEEIPVSISVWDEDHIDLSKDERIDINPKAGVLDLIMMFKVSDGSLSGDVNGIFRSHAATFSSEGQKPEKSRAYIEGFITSRPVL